MFNLFEGRAINRTHMKYTSILIGIWLTIALAGGAVWSESLQIDSDQALARYNSGKQFFEAANYQQAIESWQDALRFYRQLQDQQGVGSVLSNLAMAYLKLGDDLKSVTLLEEALAGYDTSGDKEGTTFALESLLDIYKRRSDFKNTIKYYERLLAAARRGGERKRTAELLFDLALTRGKLGNYRDEIAHLKDALAIDEELNDAQGVILDTINLADAYNKLGDYRTAIGYYNSALKHDTARDNRQGIRSDLSAIGTAYSRLGEYARATVFFERSASLAEELGDRQAMAADFGNLGIAYSKLGQSQKAIERYGKAFAAAEAAGVSTNIWASLINLGREYAKIGKYRDAITCFEKAKALLGKISVSRGEERSLLSDLGEAYGKAGEFRAAITISQAALALGSGVNNTRDDLNDLLNIGYCHGKLGEYRTAVTTLEMALEHVKKMKHENIRLNLLDLLGDHLDKLHEYKQSIDYYQQALVIADSSGDAARKGRLLAKLGVEHAWAGEYSKAITVLEQARVVADKAGDRQLKGIVLGGLGFVTMQQQWSLGFDQRLEIVVAEALAKQAKGVPLTDLGASLRQHKEISLFEQASTIAAETGDIEHQSDWLRYLGRAYFDIGDFRAAIHSYEKALKLAHSNGDREFAGVLYGGLGNCRLALGDYRTAIGYFEQARVIADQSGDADDKGVALGNLGNISCLLGDYVRGISYYEQALALGEKTNNSRTIGTALLDLGDAYRDNHNFQKAIEYYEKSRAYSLANGGSADYAEQGIGDAYLALGRDADAYYFYLRSNNPVQLGRYQLKQHHFSEAKAEFNRGRAEAEAARNASAILPRWIGLGLACEGLKEYDEAYGWYRKAVAFMEEQREQLAPGEREHYFDGKVGGLSRIEAYEGAARCAYLLGHQDESFYWAENTRGRLMSELLARRKSGTTYKIPPGLAVEEEKLVSDILINRRARQSAYGQNTPGQQQLLEAEYANLKVALDRLIDRFRKEYPQYASIRYPQPEKLSQLALRSKETIVEYEVTEPYTIGFVIRDGKIVKTFKVAVTRVELSALVTRFRAPFQDGLGGREARPDLAKELGKLLLGPAVSVLNRGERLIIIPDESLSLLPFEALMLPTPDASKGTSVYAMDKYPISYYQSASVLSLQRTLHISRTNLPTFFGLGDPVYDTADQRAAGMRSLAVVQKQSGGRVGSNPVAEAGYQFARLPNTGKEVREVGKLFTSTLLLGLDASIAKLQKLDLSRQRYLLFSTHGVLGDEIPYVKEPALVLSLIDNNEEGRFLTASKIFELNLNADLVGLSACNTGLGIQSAGEGVVGLSRAFMYAGTDTVLVSLWSVADESTYHLMVRFFTNLKAGMDKLSALQDAKNYLRSIGYDSPFYWASFVLVGEVR